MDVTRTLLDKNPDELSDSERLAVDRFRRWKKNTSDEISKTEARLRKDCKVLLSGIEKRPIPDYGWLRPVEDLCYALEALNVRYAKWGLSVVLDQAKEKFGTLRFYTHIEQKETGIAGFVLKPVDWLENILSKVDYGRKNVIDRPAYTSVEWVEIDKEKYDKGLDIWGVDISSAGKNVVKLKGRNELINLTETENNTYFTEENGKYFYTRTVQHMSEGHVEFTKHRVLRFFLGLLRSFSFQVSYFLPSDSRKQEVMMRDLDIKVRNLTNEASDKCESRCQFCGAPLDGEKNKRCVTQGWFMFLCEPCAKSTGMTYRIGNDFFCEGIKDETRGKGSDGGQG